MAANTARKKKQSTKKESAAVQEVTVQGIWADMKAVEAKMGELKLGDGNLLSQRFAGFYPKYTKAMSVYESFVLGALQEE